MKKFICTILACALFPCMCISGGAAAGEKPPKKARVAVTCWNFSKSALPENLGKILALIDETAKCSPDFIVLGEGAYGLDASWQPNAESIPGPFSEALGAKSKEYGCYIVGNMFELDTDGTRYNTNIVMGKNGQLVSKYRKMALPPAETAPPYNLTAGTDAAVFDTEFGRVATAICYDIDHRFPEITKAFADAGAKLLMVPSLGDYTYSGMLHARENNLFMAVTALHHDWDDPYTNSSIIAPDGSIINGIEQVTADNGLPKYCYADLDLEGMTYDVPEPKIPAPIAPPPDYVKIPFVSAVSSDSSGGTDASSLIDGEIDRKEGRPYWETDKLGGSAILDLGAVKKVGYIGVVQLDTFCLTSKFKLSVSQDGKNYIEIKGRPVSHGSYGSADVVDKSGQFSKVDCYTVPVFPGYKMIDLPPYAIRYVKIEGYGQDVNKDVYGNYVDAFKTAITEVTAFTVTDKTQAAEPFPYPAEIPVAGEGEILVVVDGNQVTFDVQPVIREGRNLVPLRAFCNAIGIGNDNIGFESGRITIVRPKSKLHTQMSIALHVDDDQVTVVDDGKEKFVTLDVPAAVIDGRTLVPLRFISETFGYNVEWISNHNGGGTVVLNEK